MLVVHIYCIFLICLFMYIPAYLVLHIATYFLHISAHLNLPIMAPGIFTLMHIQANNTYMHINVYLCIFLAYYAHILHISHFYNCANFLHIRFSIFHAYFCIF